MNVDRQKEREKGLREREDALGAVQSCVFPP